MKYKLLLLMNIVGYDAHAIRWPSLSDPVITLCDNQNTACNSNVWYRHNGTVFLEQPEIAKPPNTQLIIKAYGIHCDYGSKLPGYESAFGSCSWDGSTTHAPVTNNCMLESSSRWDLTNASSCTTGLTWGGHGGAGPGGECVLFGILVGGSGGLLHTPMGAMDATAAANSGNRFCVKPLPPATKCDLQLNDTILNHGVLTPNDSSTASVTGVIDCGRKPVVEFVGGADFMIAPGINGKLNADIDTVTNKIKLNSLVTTVNAKGGDYNVSKVITVSPW